MRQLCGALVCLLFGTSVLAQSAQPGAITGAVIARATGAAVAGALVRVEGANLTATTSGTGRFTIENAPSGPVTLTVEAAGFLPQRVPNVRRDGENLAIELEATPNFMDRVQVTATKVPLSVGDVAGQADVVDRATIETRGDQTLTQAIAHVPGVIVSTQLGLFESVLLRGLPRAGNEFTNTLLLVDGVPQANSGNSARLVGLTINDASSIEVIRGPNSALYGRTAIGGSVNLRTADPTPVHQAGVEFTTGEFGTAKGIGRVSGPVSHWGGYYVSVGKERNGGYFENRTTDDYTVGNTALFGKLTFTPDARSHGSISLNRVDSENSTPTNEPIINGRLLHEIDPRFDRFTNFNIPGPNYNQDETRLTFNYTRELAPWARLTEVFGYRDVLHAFVDDGDFIGSPYDLAANTVTQYPFSQELDENVFFQELRVDLTPRVGSLTVGGSYERINGTLATDFIFTDEDLFGWTINYLNPVIPPRSEWQHDASSRVYHLGVTGIFAQYLVEPMPRVVLSAGGRYDRLDLDNTRGGGARLDADFNAFSPKLSATYRLLDPGGNANLPSVNVYGLYSRAFLPPRRPSSLVPADVPLNLQPEDIDNYEGGLKASVLENRLALEATYFWMKHDGVVLDTRQGAFFLPTNAGEQRYKGLETGARLAITPKVSTYVNASFYRNRFGRFVIESEDGDEVLTGNRLPIAPDRVINWGALVRPRTDLDLTVNVKNVGDVVTDRDNAFTLDPYTLVDAAATWRRGRLRVTLSGHNLFNAEYYSEGDSELASPGSPRQILLSTAIAFR
jgi:outer membrane receptor protein involved in Fe transport